MKTLKKLSILFLSLITFYACNDDDLNVDNPDGNYAEGGLLDVKNTSMNYVVGNPGPYTASVRVYQSNVKTTSVRIAKTFYSGGVASNTIDNFKTITISDTDQNSLFSFDFTFNELIDGLTYEGSSLSTNDGDYTIGDYWELEYYVTTSNGEFKNYQTTQSTISTRFAGIYKVLKGEYFRIGENNGGGAMWTGGEVTIKSIDAITYQWAEWGILSGWTDNVLYFQIDPNTLEITFPEEWDGVAQTLNGQPLTTYPANSTDLTNVIGFTMDPNKATLVDSGADTLDMVYGYFTGGSGPREFYHFLEKIVD